MATLSWWYSFHNNEQHFEKIYSGFLLSLNRLIIWNIVLSIELKLSQYATNFLVSLSSDILMKISQIVETTSMWGNERLHRSARLAKMHNAMPLFSISLRQQDCEYLVANSKTFNLGVYKMWCLKTFWIMFTLGTLVPATYLNLWLLWSNTPCPLMNIENLKPTLCDGTTFSLLSQSLLLFEYFF